jgi:hypothetical protein
MRFRVLLVLFAVLIAGPAFAGKIYIDYDKEYDGSKNKTWAWVEADNATLAQTDPLLHSKIVETIAGYIKESGVTQVDDDPDVYVTYHGSSKEEMSVNTTSMGYGYPGSWGYGSYGGYGGYYGRYYGGSYGGYAGSATSTVSSYQVGSLVIDIWDAETEEIVWRGIAADIVIPDNPAKLEKKIDKALSKMVAQWRRMKKKANK